MKAVVLLLLLGQKFYSDDPIKDDRDNLPIDRPATIELSATYDLLSNTFAAPKLEHPIPRAMNTNTLGEVPNSSWFTNRIGVRNMSPEELARGPGSGGRPTSADRSPSSTRSKVVSPPASPSATPAATCTSPNSTPKRIRA